MKKILFFLTLFTFTCCFGQTPVITMISDGDCSGGTPKVVELYAQGTVDFSLYSIELQSNATLTWGSVESLASLGVITDAFVYLYRTADQAIFDVEFPSVLNTLGLAPSLTFNGNDRIRIVETATSTVIDQFGEEGVDGTGTAWEYVDGYAKRNNSTGPENPFVIANWTYGNGALNTLGVCQGGADPFETIIGIGTYTPIVVPADPTILATPTSLAGFTQFVGTPSTEQTFEVSGTLLTDDITLTVTSGDYELSETSGGVFGPTITLTQTGGEVAATTIYVRLNGLLAASPSNGDVTLTSTGATDVVVTLEGQILNPAPTVFVSETALTGFTHFVGTPSAEQTFTASGLELSADITIAAPTNFEVSLTTSTGFTNSLVLTQTAGIVASTTIYVRANASTAGSFSGNIIATSAGALNDTVNVSGIANDYVYYTIDQISTVDTTGVADSLNVLVEVTGVMYCIDFDGNTGYSITLIDGSGEGINLYRISDISGYTSPMEGDSLRVFGKIAQYNGLLEIIADSIEVLAQGVAIMPATLVTTLGESTESQFIRMDNLTFVTPMANFATGSTNVSVTDGTNTFVMRIDSDTDIPGAPAPQGLFSVIGVGGQFDNSAPFDSGYQIFPCGLSSIIPACIAPSTATTPIDSTGAMATAMGTNIMYQWIDCANNTPIQGATNQSFVAVTAGNYAVIVSDGPCSDTSACVALASSTNSLNENVLINALRVYPNPVEDLLTIKNTSNSVLSFEVVDMNGRVISTNNSVTNSTTISTSSWNSGVYFVNFSSNKGKAVLKVVK
jgi:DNA/RNA endonuclease YhcR with UshA esterase domain